MLGLRDPCKVATLSTRLHLPHDVAPMAWRREITDLHHPSGIVRQASYSDYAHLQKYEPPSGDLEKQIEQDFGSLDKLVADFNPKTAAIQAWLLAPTLMALLTLHTMPGQDCRRGCVYTKIAPGAQGPCILLLQRVIYGV